MKKEMLINVLQPEECRIAILEDGVLEELYVERTSHESYVGNVYKGRIVNIEPSIQAAFVDFGVGRNGFLHVSDVEPAYYRHLEGFREGERQLGGRDRFRGSPRDQAPRPRRDERRAEPMPDSLEEPPAGPEMSDESTSAPPIEGRKGRRPSRGRSRRGRKDEGAPESTLPPDLRQAADEPAAPRADLEPPPGPEAWEEEPPRFMDSAERRTDKDAPSMGSGGGGPDDDLLFFPRAQSHEGPIPAAREEEPRSAEDAGSWQEAVQESIEATETAQTAEDWEESEPAAEGVAVETLEEFDEEGDQFAPRRRPRGNDRRDDRRGGPRGRPSGPPRRAGFGRPKPLIQDIFRRGQEVLVQVIKEGIGTKGPTLSTYISIAGRYLVLMPGLNRIGVSRKIADDEQRRRLRDILSDLQPPRGLGFIIRTAGLDRTKKELQRDLAYLSRLWQVVVRRIRKLKAPVEIYQESDMITRTIRDTFTNEIDTIWVDEPAAFEHAQEFLQIVMPRYANRIKLYQGPEPLFHKNGIEDEIARIQQRHVPLPNGGSIVIEQTEALVAIDVNSGNFRADNNAEETAYQMNLLAAKEIARQLRLRDLGGVIVNDFIDMRDDKHRRSVERALRDAIKRDRARSKVLRISAFGIIEMTRQRIRPSLKRSVYQDCAHCVGMGQVKTCESMSIDVMRMLQLAAHREHVQRIQVVVSDDVAHYLLNKKRTEISRLEEGQIQVTVTGETGARPEKLDFTCYDKNNNEVKFFPHEEPMPRRR